MGDTQSNIRLEQWLSKNGYSNPLTVQSQIRDVHKAFPKLKLKNGGSVLVGDPPRICLDGAIIIESTPAAAKNEVALKLIIPHDYPNQPPSVSIKAPEGFVIIPNKNVDVNGSVRIDALTFRKWATQTVDQTTLVAIIEVNRTNNMVS